MLMSKLDANNLPSANLTKQHAPKHGLGLTDVPDNGWIEVGGDSLEDLTQSTAVPEVKRGRSLRFSRSTSSISKHSCDTRILGSALLPLTPDQSPDMNFNAFGEVSQLHLFANPILPQTILNAS